MIEVIFSLHNVDYDEPADDQVRQCERVPQVGEFLDFDGRRSYVVTDVLWHMAEGHGQRVTIQAFERDWHQNFDQVTRAWRASLEAGESG